LSSGGDVSALTFMKWPQEFRVLRADAELFGEPLHGPTETPRPLGVLQQGALVEVLGQDRQWLSLRPDPKLVRRLHIYIFNISIYTHA
jgi:hypothetical protein